MKKLVSSILLLTNLLFIPSLSYAMNGPNDGSSSSGAAYINDEEQVKEIQKNLLFFHVLIRRVNLASTSPGKHNPRHPNYELAKQVGQIVSLVIGGDALREAYFQFVTDNLYHTQAETTVWKRQIEYIEKNKISIMSTPFEFATGITLEVARQAVQQLQKLDISTLPVEVQNLWQENLGLLFSSDNLAIPHSPMNLADEHFVATAKLRAEQQQEFKLYEQLLAEQQQEVAFNEQLLAGQQEELRRNELRLAEQLERETLRLNFAPATHIVPTTTHVAPKLFHTRATATLNPIAATASQHHQAPHDPSSNP